MSPKKISSDLPQIMILDRPESIFVIVHLLKILDRITGPRAKSFKVTSQKVRVEFIRKDFIKGLRLNSERL